MGHRRDLRHRRAPLRALIHVAQVHLLGFNLSAFDQGHPLGWSVLSVTDDTCVLGTNSERASSRIVGTKTKGQLVITTLNQLDATRSRQAWRVVAPVHRAVTRYLIDRAVAGG